MSEFEGKAFCVYCETHYPADQIRTDKDGDNICMSCAEEPDRLCEGEWCLGCNRVYIPEAEIIRDLDGDAVCVDCLNKRLEEPLVTPNLLYAYLNGGL